MSEDDRVDSVDWSALALLAVVALLALLAGLASTGCSSRSTIEEPDGTRTTYESRIGDGELPIQPLPDPHPIDRPDPPSGVDPPEPDSDAVTVSRDWLEAIHALIRDALRQLGPAPERIREPLWRALREIGQRARE